MHEMLETTKWFGVSSLHWIHYQPVFDGTMAPTPKKKSTYILPTRCIPIGVLQLLGSGWAGHERHEDHGERHLYPAQFGKCCVIFLDVTCPTLYIQRSMGSINGDTGYQNRWMIGGFIMEHPINIYKNGWWLEVPPFQETSIWQNKCPVANIFPAEFVATGYRLHLYIPLNHLELEVDVVCNMLENSAHPIPLTRNGTTKGDSPSHLPNHSRPLPTLERLLSGNVSMAYPSTHGKNHQGWMSHFGDVQNNSLDLRLDTVDGTIFPQFCDGWDILWPLIEAMGLYWV